MRFWASSEGSYAQSRQSLRFTCTHIMKVKKDLDQILDLVTSEWLLKEGFCKYGISIKILCAGTNT